MGPRINKKTEPEVPSTAVWHSQTPKVADAVVDPIIVKAIESPESAGGIVAACKMIVDRLKQSGLAREMTLSPKQLGMHPCNRSTYGCHEDWVRKLAADIFEVGWDWEKVRGGLAVEDDTDKHIAMHNVKLCNESEYLAPVDPRSIVAGTLTNGHTIMMLRSIVAGVTCSLPGLTVDNKMSLEVVQKVRPEMAKAAQEGWTWTVLSKECKGLYGDTLFELLSGVHNLTLSRSEHELEVLIKIYRMACEYTTQSKIIDWQSISKTIARTKPECCEYLQSMIKFVQSYGGGLKSGFIEDVCRFHARHVPGQRLVGGAVFESLATITFVKENSKSQCVLLRYAVLKAVYTCPPDKIFNKVCKFVSKADFDTMTNPKKGYDASCQAEMILSRARAIVIRLGDKVHEDVRTKLLGTLDVNVIRVLLNKQQNSVVKFPTMGAAASTFISDLSKAVGEPVVDPWSSEALTETQSEAASSSKQNGMRTFGLDGKIVSHTGPEDIKGIKVGMEVVLKADAKKHCPQVYTVHSISTDTVTVREKVNNTDTDVQHKMFCNAWQAFVEEFLPVSAEFSGPDHKQFDIVTKKSVVQVGLGHLASLHGCPNVAVQAKPAKRVIAKESFKPGALVLVPMTLNVTTKMPDEKLKGNSIGVHIDDFEPCMFGLMPPQMNSDETKQPFNVPFWAVRAVQPNEVDEANMKYISRSVDVACTPKAKGENNKMTVNYVVLVNTKAVKAGDELVVLSDVATDEDETPNKKKPRK